MMKTNEEGRILKIVLWIALVYYLNSILSIALAFIYSEVRYYSIIFWTLFSLDQLYVLLKIQHKRKCAFIFCWVLDIIHLSPLVMFFSVDILEYTLSHIQNRLYTRILPQLLSQTILFFEIGFKGLSKSQPYVIILAYTNFLMLLYLAVFLFPSIRNAHEKVFKKILINILSVYIILAALFTLKDQYGLNIGFYSLGIGALTLLIGIYHYPQPSENWRREVTNYRVYFFYLSVFQLPLKELLGAQRAQEKRICILQYAINQIIRFILLIIFGYYNFEYSSKGFTFGEQIEIMTQVIGLLLGLIQLKGNVKILLNCFVQTKVVSLKFTDKKGYKKQLQKIPKKKRFLTGLLVDYKFGEIKYFQYIDSLQRNCDFQCKLSIKLYNKLDYLYRQDVEIYYDNIPMVCIDHVYTLMESVQNFPERVLKMFPNPPLFDEDQIGLLNHIIIKRYEKGFFCSGYENNINNILKVYLERFLIELNSRESVGIFDQLISNTLEVFAFQKKVQQHLPLLSSTLLTDLYE